MTNYILSLRWVDYFYYTITEPGKLSSLFSEQKKKLILFSFLIPVFKTAVEIISLALIFKDSSYFYYRISIGWFLNSCVIIISIIFISGAIDTIFQFMGYKGDVKKVIIIYNFSNLPYLFILPALLLINSLNLQLGILLFFYFSIYGIILIWSIIIFSKSIAQVHGISILRAAGILLLPFFILFLFIIILNLAIFVNFTGII